MSEDKTIDAETLRNAPTDIAQAVTQAAVVTMQAEELRKVLVVPDVPNRAEVMEAAKEMYPGVDVVEAQRIAAPEVEARPAPERAPQTSRAVMAGILGTLADVLDSSVENSKAALLDLQGVERLDCETYIKTATELCKGMRADARRLAEEPSRIVKPGEAGAKPKRFVALSDAQALGMVRGGKG